MANHLGLHSLAESIVTRLRNAYPQALRDRHPCSFRLMSSAAMAQVPDEGSSVLSLYLFRVSIDPHARNVRPPGDALRADVPLPVEAHLMLTVWADTAPAELAIFAWALRELYRAPVLDASTLSPDAAWGAGEVVQLVPAEISTEDMMRIWDALEPSYRLSTTFVARPVRLEDARLADAAPVVARRFELADEMP